MYINKVIITAEAEFDYINELQLCSFPKKDIKKEVEEYLSYMELASRLIECRYFRIKYYDEKWDKMLMLFFYKGQTFSNMRMWKLSGVCYAEDWNEDLEEEGNIRSWLKNEIYDLPEEKDRIVIERTNEILKNTDKTIFDKVIEEVTNAFECERDKEVAKEVAFLQSAYFEFSGRGRINKKDKCYRKGNN